MLLGVRSICGGGGLAAAWVNGRSSEPVIPSAWRCASVSVVDFLRLELCVDVM